MHRCRAKGFSEELPPSGWTLESASAQSRSVLSELLPDGVLVIRSGRRVGRGMATDPR